MNIRKFTPEFTPDLSTNSHKIYPQIHNRFIQKLIPEFTQDSHKIYPRIHTRFIQKLIPEFTPDLFKNLSPNTMRKCDILPRTILSLISHYSTHFWTFEYQRKSLRNCTHSALYHSFLTIALISELFNNRVYKRHAIKIRVKTRVY